MSHSYSKTLQKFIKSIVKLKIYKYIYIYSIKLEVVVSKRFKFKFYLTLRYQIEIVQICFFFILICCQLHNHYTSGVTKTFCLFLCFLSLLLHYYSIPKLQFVPSLFFMFSLHMGYFVHSFFVFATSFSVILYRTNSLLWMLLGACPPPFTWTKWYGCGCFLRSPPDTVLISTSITLGA